MVWRVRVRVRANSVCVRACGTFASWHECNIVGCADTSALRSNTRGVFLPCNQETAPQPQRQRPLPNGQRTSASSLTSAAMISYDVTSTLNLKTWLHVRLTTPRYLPTTCAPDRRRRYPCRFPLRPISTWVDSRFGRFPLGPVPASADSRLGRLPLGPIPTWADSRLALPVNTGSYIAAEPRRTDA